MSDVSQIKLATAAATGNDVALDALVRTYHDRVYRYGIRACADRYDADDAVQEAFIKLASRPDVMRDKGALFWLLSVVRSSCLKLLRPFLRERRHLGQRSDPEQETDANRLDPEQSLQRFELVSKVHAAIASLERPYREVLVLRDLEGLSGLETCEALGLELATMKTRLHRARAALRAELHDKDTSALEQNYTLVPQTPMRY